MSDSKLDKKIEITPETKQKLIKVGVIILVVGLVWAFIRTTGTNKLAEAEPEAIHLGMENDLLTEDKFKGFEDGLQQQDQVINDVNQRVIGQDEKVASLQEELLSLKENFLKQYKEGTLPTSENSLDLPVEVSNKGFPAPPPPLVNNIQNSQVMQNIETTFTEEWVGGLNVYVGSPVPSKATKKKTQKFYMPPSFFGAKLLSGIDAMTNKEALQMPETVMLMVDAPAVLPNHIKKNLQGCYVVANANGNLAKERVQLQAVSLSCLSADGNAVIDETILGFVADNDGKRDLKGNVVARQGSNTALLVAASIIGAIGNQAALSTVTQTTNTTTGTSTQSFDGSEALKSGIGTGISDGTKEYKNILIEYIRQSSPVIEIGAMKDATVFIQKGVWLNIMDTKDAEDSPNA